MSPSNSDNTPSESHFQSSDRKWIQIDTFIRDIYIPLVHVIDDILDKESKGMVCRNYADIILESNSDTISILFAQSIGGEFISELFQHIVSDIPDDKFKDLFYSIKGIYDVAVFEGSKDASSIDSLKQLYQKLLNSEKGKRILSNRKEMIDSLKIGLKSLLEGNTDVFRNRHFIHSIPEAIGQLFSRGKDKTAETILEKFINGLRSEDVKTRSDIAQSLSLIISTLISENRYELFYQLSPGITQWILSENDAIPSYSIICNQLQTLAQHLIQYNQYEETNFIIKIFNDIADGKLQKPPVIQNQAKQIIKGIAREDILDILMNEFLTDEENKRRAASDCLILLGSESSRRLLTVLRESESRYERSRILLVLSDIGSMAMPAIIESFNLGEPWYFIRNLVLLVGRLGNKTHLSVLQPLLTYGDIRVQREAITSINNIAGAESEKIFLSAFPDADDRLKIDIIDILVSLNSQQAARYLADLLKSGLTMSSSVMRNELAAKICNALGIIGSEKTASILQDVIAQKQVSQGGKPFDEKVISAAVSALTQISQKKDKKQLVVNSEEKVLTQQEKFIERYLDRWNNDDTVEEYAVNILLELILKYVSDKDFDKAVIFRNKLIQIDPMASKEIQIADDFINRGKKEVLKNNHFNIWANLYAMLSEEESKILFNALLVKDFGKNQLLYQQGDFNRFLYFIDSGEFKIVYSKEINEEIFVKEITAGDIAGEDNFFVLSYCTTSAYAVSESKAFFLDRDIFQKWKTSNPSLASKITNYCLKIESIYMILKKNNIERRVWDRRIVSEDITAKLINDARSPAIRGNLLNISQGGLSFSASIPNKIAGNLLGQDLRLQYHLRTNPMQTDRKGTVVSVFDQSSDIYSLHIKFDSVIEESPPAAPSEKIKRKTTDKDSFLVTKW